MLVESKCQRSMVLNPVEEATPVLGRVCASLVISALLGIFFWREGFEGAFRPVRRGAKGFF
jgi:hypothetical protein